MMIRFFKDLDKDGIKDSIIIDYKELVIIVKLSPQNFSKISSEILDNLNSTSELELTKNGFSFSNSWPRSGYTCSFIYDPKEKKIQLIKISRYDTNQLEYVDVVESSVDLLTNKYVSKLSKRSEYSYKFKKLLTIRGKMIFPKIYLEDFNDEVYHDYLIRCLDFYDSKEEILRKKNNTDNTEIN